MMVQCFKVRESFLIFLPILHLQGNFTFEGNLLFNIDHLKKQNAHAKEKIRQAVVQNLAHEKYNFIASKFNISYC